MLGKQIDGKSDVYSFGLCVWELFSCQVSRETKRKQFQKIEEKNCNAFFSSCFLPTTGTVSRIHQFQRFSSRRVLQTTTSGHGHECARPCQTTHRALLGKSLSSHSFKSARFTSQRHVLHRTTNRKCVRRSRKSSICCQTCSSTA